MCVAQSGAFLEVTTARRRRRCQRRIYAAVLLLDQYERSPVLP